MGIYTHITCLIRRNVDGIYLFHIGVTQKRNNRRYFKLLQMLSVSDKMMKFDKIFKIF